MDDRNAERIRRGTEIPSRRRRGRNGGEKGGSLVEAAFVTSLIYAPFLVGLIVLGLGTINRIQLDQLTRDVGIMHARGLDFTGQQSRDMFYKLTEGTPFRKQDGGETSYNGTMIVSTVRYLGSTDCPSGCANINMPVVTHRVVLGDPNLHTSQFATPTNVDPVTGRVIDYRNDSSARATGILVVLSGMLPGDEAYVAEGYMITPGFSFPDLQARSESTSWAIF